MMRHTNTLVNLQNGDLAFRIQAFDDNTPFDHLQRHNYYTIILLKEGKGKLKADFSDYVFQGKTLFCFSPYQPYMIDSAENSPLSGVIINFHADFFCIYRHQNAIELHYKHKHTASDYADMLHITAKALAKMVKSHFHKTLTDLIGERIVMEAKRELYLTSKPVKEIAYILGFNDEYYFSRFFKRNTDVSPQLYRDTVGFAKAEKLLQNVN